MNALDPDCGNPALALLEFEAHAFALIQLAKPGMLNGADMNKNIRAAIIRRDEAVAFAWVKPFYNAGERRIVVACAVS